MGYNASPDGNVTCYGPLAKCSGNPESCPRIPDSSPVQVPGTDHWRAAGGDPGTAHGDRGSSPPSSHQVLISVPAAPTESLHIWAIRDRVVFRRGF